MAPVHVVRPAWADGHLPARQRDSPITGCTKQYKGYRERRHRRRQEHPAPGDPATTARHQRQLHAELAKVFHQWVTFCTFTPTVKGDYYLQIRTNVTIPGTAARRRRGRVQRQRERDHPDRRRHQRAGQREQPVRSPGDRAAPGLGVDLRLGAHGNLRQLQAASIDVQPRAGDPGRGEQDLEHRVLRRGRRRRRGTIKVLPPLESNLPGSALRRPKAWPGAPASGS